MFIVMTGGMARIAGTVFVLYATILGPYIPDAAGHIVVASVLGAPAAIFISLLMVPDPQEKHTGGKLDDVARSANSTMDAIVKGTGSGLELLLNIVAMLIVFVALVYLANAILGLLPDFLGAPLTMQRVLGWIMAPVCWLIGIPWSQAVTAGGLMGIKTVLNEFVAYLQLAALPPGTLDPRSQLIMLYAMCGFANFGSLGIMIAGLTTMCPEKRDEVVSLGLEIDRVRHADDVPARRDRGRAELASFLPRDSGEGGPCEAWWKGRGPRRLFGDDSVAESQTPLPPRFARSPSPVFTGEDICRDAISAQPAATSLSVSIARWTRSHRRSAPCR